MSPKALLCTLPLLALLLAPVSPAAANDTAIGGSGASLGPIEETRAAMRSEHIRIRLEEDTFHVHATYRLANLSDEPLSLRIGFPEPVCDPMHGECMPGVRKTFLEMRTTLRGEEVPALVEKTGRESAWAEDYPLLWTFSVDFAPSEEVEVVHTYRVVPSANSLGTLYLHYIVRTGANWGAPISSAVFELDLPAGTCGAQLHGAAEDALLLGHIHLTGQAAAEDPEARDAALAAAQRRHALLPLRDPETGRWHARWEYRDWVPEEDFTVSALPWEGCLFDLGCPAVWAAPTPEDPEGGLADLGGEWTPETLRLCRNLPWALTGYGFASEDLRDAFYGQDTAFSRQDVLPHGPEDAWSEDRLTPAMVRYARWIRSIEEGMRP